MFSPFGKLHSLFLRQNSLFYRNNSLFFCVVNLAGAFEFVRVLAFKIVKSERVRRNSLYFSLLAGNWGAEKGSTMTACATTQSRATRDFLKPREWLTFGGLQMRELYLCIGAIMLGADFGGFVSGRKIRLPGNRDRRE
jgi:hypothetical protein